MASAYDHASIKARLKSVPCPFNWDIHCELKRLKDRMDDWVPTKDCEKSHPYMIMKAYLAYKMDDDPEKAEAFFSEVIMDDDNNIAARGSLAYIFYDRGEIDSCMDMLKKSEQAATVDDAYNKALYAEAFAYMHMGPAGTVSAQRILEKLYARKYGHEFIITDLIRFTHRQVHSGTRVKCKTTQTMHALFEKVEQYILEGYRLIPNDLLFWCEILNTYNAAITNPEGKTFKENFIRKYPHLSPEECVEQAKKLSYGDFRDKMRYKSLHFYYKGVRDIDASIEIMEEAMQRYSKDRSLRTFYLKTVFTAAKKEFQRNRRSSVFGKYVDVFVRKCTEVVHEYPGWWYTYRLCTLLGQAYYLKGEAKEADAWMTRSEERYRSLREDEAPGVAFTNLSRCYSIVLSGMKNVLFIQIRKVLDFEGYQGDTKAQLRRLFETAGRQNRTDVFYKLCNGVLKFQIGNYTDAEGYFNDVLALPASPIEETESYLGRAKCLLQREMFDLARQNLEDAQQTCPKDSEGAYKNDFDDLKGRLDAAEAAPPLRPQNEKMQDQDGSAHALMPDDLVHSFQKLRIKNRSSAVSCSPSSSYKYAHVSGQSSNRGCGRARPMHHKNRRSKQTFGTKHSGNDASLLDALYELLEKAEARMDASEEK